MKGSLVTSEVFNLASRLIFSSVSIDKKLLLLFAERIASLISDAEDGCAG